MNIHYIQMPTNYADSLKRNGESEKFKAFLEYFYDLQKCAMEKRESNSIRYYAKSWGTWERGKSVKPKSNSLVDRWITEFTLEIDRYYASWSLVNSQNAARVKNSSVAKQKERLKNGERTPKGSLNAENREFQEPKRTLKEEVKNKEVNLNDDDRVLRREFEKLWFVYRAFNGSYTGNKEEGLKAFKEMDGSLPYKEIEKAIKLYMVDAKVSKKCGIEKFFKNNVYLDYTTKRVSVFYEGRWINGSYLAESFVADDGTEMILSAEGFAKMFAKDEVKLLDLDERVA